MPDHEHVTLRGAADRYLGHGELVDIERRLLERTWLLDLLSPLAPTVSASALRDRIVHAFDDLDALAVEEGERPIFAFIHVPAPHLPVVLGAQGNLNGLGWRRFASATPSGVAVGSQEFQALYAAGLTYLNRRTLQAVDTLVHSRGANPPVVIVMSDHGYNTDVAQGSVADQFGNLFAAFTPDAPELLASGPTPVNILPILFNHYLGTEIPESPDRFFVSPNALNSPLIMTEVSAIDLQ